jgi:hypothetical protein
VDIAIFAGGDMTSVNIDFENYLQEKHADQYVGLDDLMPDDYNDWLDSLDVQEIIDYANSYIKNILEKEIV